MTIGIDIDDTMTETSKKAMEYLNKYEPSYKDYHNLPKELYLKYMQLYIDDILGNAELKNGVKDALDYLKSKNFNIVIITARSNTYSSNVIDITHAYLKKYQIPYDKIFFNKEIKGKTAKENNVDIFIDDKENVLDDVNSYGIECIRIGNGFSKYKTFNNWKDIIDYIKLK